ncbi:hypothetical protein SPHINGO8BC_51183 [Sphingobacterium multivorum]|uniref:Uncharacterized protein n=1 Tax=Sphingobacterium multivorum TaxID=28454 RepID=A0A654CUE3_SPHMU|nr:hypothetical protein SPHINGO8BC_51183 [Sphingobacterium multivorum]
MARLAPIESYLINDIMIASRVYLLSTLNLKGNIIINSLHGFWRSAEAL